MCIALYKSQN